MTRESLARRRHNAAVRKARNRRRAAAPRDQHGLRQVDALPWKVTLPLKVAEHYRDTAKDLFLDAIKRVPVEWSVEAKVTDEGVTLILNGVVAPDSEDAKQKAVYWCRRACRKHRVIRWTGLPISDIEAEHA